MNVTQHFICVTIFYSMGQGKQHITKTSINAIRANLSKYYNINIGRSWCFECVGWLLKNGFIKRQPRYEKYDGGFIRKKSSLLFFTLKGAKWLLTSGMTKIKYLYESILNYLIKKQKTFPSKEDFLDGQSVATDKDIPKRLKNLLAGIGTSI